MLNGIESQNVNGNFLIDGQFDELPPRNHKNIISSEIEDSKLNGKEMGYYCTHYFKNFIKNGLYNDKDKISKLSACNLEFFPYRSVKINDVKIKRNKSKELYKMPSVQISLKIISDRLEAYEKNKNVKPIFIFRGYDKWWEPALIKYLGEQKFNKYSSMFFTFSSYQCACISSNNLLNIKGHKKLKTIKKSAYKDNLRVELKKEAWKSLPTYISSMFE
ncbi:hypothetical protein [Apilactobacillus xinyiensis]|uniref:hypothetical protein n=1 Tax=Apilactobacillus xinyiensis TaxID=2841032 RepID=UPI00200F1DA7|nr:hypothetical protein [Apilactobacillus xinyiensis]MCL0319315.1 hypothetical protein [Apilactobacillus xinyiensis]